MSKTMLEQMCEASPEGSEIMAVAIKNSQFEDVLIQIRNRVALVIKGEVYEEQAGRLVQLKALNDGKVEYAGATCSIKSATVSKDLDRHYDFILLKADAGEETIDVTISYQVVRKMIERKSIVLDAPEDHLLQKLIDVNEGDIKVNGTAFTIVGEQWTQSKPGHRDLILIPASERLNGDNMVTKTVSEKLIMKAIELGEASFRIHEQDDGLSLG
jgi:hypothetical protein